MKTVYRIFKEHALIIASVLFFGGFGCELPTLVKSGFFSHNSEAILTSLTVCYIAILLIHRIFSSHTAVYAATVASVLTMANWSQVMLYYSCNMDHTEIMSRCMKFSVYAAAAAVGGFIILDILNKIRKKRWLVTILFVLASFALAGLVFITNSDSNTSNLLIGGRDIQPAIIMLFAMIYSLSGYLSRVHTKPQRALYLISFFALAGVLVLKHELGIPFFVVISFVIMYVFLSSSFNMKTLILPLAIMGTGGVIMMLKNAALRADTITKITERSDVNDQASKALSNLTASSWLGSYSYDIYLPEASSDLALNNNTHFWGYLWLFIFILTLSIYCMVQWIEFTRSDGTSMINNLRKLAFTSFAVIAFYNILDNICGWPIIGVQLMFSGKSLSVAVLSGLFLGTVVFDVNIKDISENILILSNKIVETFSDADEDTTEEMS